MTKNDFLNTKCVSDFIKWLEQFLDGNFSHKYIFKKNNRTWECNSIYNAYENYRLSNGTGNFEQSQKELNLIKQKLNNSLDNCNCNEVKNACIDMLKWGGLEGP